VGHQDREVPAVVGEGPVEIEEEVPEGVRLGSGKRRVVRKRVRLDAHRINRANDPRVEHVGHEGRHPGGERERVANRDLVGRPRRDGGRPQRRVVGCDVGPEAEAVDDRADRDPRELRRGDPEQVRARVARFTGDRVQYARSAHGSVRVRHDHRLRQREAAQDEQRDDGLEAGCPHRKNLRPLPDSCGDPAGTSDGGAARGS
jgi:hypothetical protein